MNEANGWKEYQKLVLNELERHNNLIEAVRKDISNLSTDVATLKVKAGVWGFVAGAIPVVLAIAVSLLKGT